MVEERSKAYSYIAMVWKVIDVREGSKKADTPVVLWTKKQDGTQSQNQLWIHHDGFIVNVHSRLVLDIRGCKETTFRHAMISTFTVINSIL